MSFRCVNANERYTQQPIGWEVCAAAYYCYIYAPLLFSNHKPREKIKYLEKRHASLFDLYWGESLWQVVNHYANHTALKSECYLNDSLHRKKLYERKVLQGGRLWNKIRPWIGTWLSQSRKHNEGQSKCVLWFLLSKGKDLIKLHVMPRSSPYLFVGQWQIQVFPALLAKLPPQQLKGVKWCRQKSQNWKAVQDFGFHITPFLFSVFLSLHLYIVYLVCNLFGAGSVFCCPL